MIPGYHLISTGHYASTHGGLVINLNKKWDYSIKATNTLSKLCEKQVIEIFDPKRTLKRKIVVGNIYRPPYNSRDNLNTFMVEFNPIWAGGGGQIGPRFVLCALANLILTLEY